MKAGNTLQVTDTEQDRMITTLLDRAKELAKQSRSPNTLGAYMEDWERFCFWCRSTGNQSMPATPKTIVLYLTAHADSLKPSTLFRHLVSISVIHDTEELPNPVRDPHVKAVFQGICRMRGVSARKVAPLRAEHLRRLDEVLPKTTQGIRDKAICLVGYAGAFRRSELVALEVGDVVFVERGMRVFLKRSKTDQKARGQIKDINTVADSQTCPVTALKDWLRQARIAKGPLFRSITKAGKVSDTGLNSQSIALVVKRVAVLLELPSEHYSGHSLRAGFVTDAIKNGISTQVIRMVTGHKSNSALEEYFREADAFGYEITRVLGL